MLEVMVICPSLKVIFLVSSTAFRRQSPEVPFLNGTDRLSSLSRQYL